MSSQADRAAPTCTFDIEDARGTALSIHLEENPMSASTNLDNLQYMRELGMPEQDVAWYAKFAASAGKATPYDKNRARRIADEAFQALCGTVVSRPVQQVM